jgi:hypothetical protein
MEAPSAKTPFGRTRRRVNILSVALTIVLPWLMFVFVFGMLSFSLHYAHPGFCWLVVVAALLIIGLCGMYALVSLRKQKDGDARHEPTWILVFTILCFIAWCLGVSLGLYNFWSCMSPHYDMQALNTYSNVDVGQLSGSAVMDAGRVTFKAESFIDASKAVGFKDVDTYCVAPISPPKSAAGPLLTYDFWAAGVNCCSGASGDFHCGEGKLELGGATRILNSEHTEKFTLATQQAASVFHFRVGHPIFLKTEADPLSAGGSAMDRGLKFYCLMALVMFGVNLFLVSVVLVLHSRFT